MPGSMRRREESGANGHVPHGAGASRRPYRDHRRPDQPRREVAVHAHQIVSFCPMGTDGATTRRTNEPGNSSPRVSWLDHPEGRIRVEELGDGRRRLTVENPTTFVAS